MIEVLENSSIAAFRSDIDRIEKEIASISHMAADLSESFQNIAKGVSSLSTTVGKMVGDSRGTAAGNKAEAATKLLGKVIGFAGDMYAGHKRDQALAKIAPKRLQLVEKKTAVITNFQTILKRQQKQLETLFKTESAREFEQIATADFVELHGETCKNTFELFVMNRYLTQVCAYTLAQFDAWLSSDGFEDSTIPEVSVKTIYSDVLENIILRNSSFSASLYQPRWTAGLWLLTETASLVSAVYRQLYRTESTKASGSSQVSSTTLYKALKDLTDEITQFGSQVPTTGLVENEVYLEAKNVLNLKHPFLYILASVTVPLTVVSYFLAGIESIVGLIFVAGISFAVGIFLSNGSKSMQLQTGFFKFVWGAVSIMTLGLMPMALNSYQKTEAAYREFLEKIE